MMNTWNPSLPRIYQIEAFSRCNLKCPFCPTGISDDKYSYHGSAMDMGLFNTIVERDLGGTNFVELQFRGEPTIHKHLLEMVEGVKKQGVMVGFSTHGGLLALSERALKAACSVHYLTVSIDGVGEESYESKRVGAKWDRLLKGLDALFANKEASSKYPIVDLQIINLSPDSEKEKAKLEALVKDKKWDATVRFQPETLLGFSEKGTHRTLFENDKTLCLNPWLSVSVHANGDVVPCCMSWDNQVVYGNLEQQSLREIWETSEVLKTFRKQHLTRCLPEMCKGCSYSSPCLFHEDLIIDSLKR